MAKRKFNLQTRNSRRLIPVGPKLHVSPLIKGLALGYRKGKKGGTWTAVRHKKGETKYDYEPLGNADDVVEADGIEVLTHDQAKDKAEEWFKRKNQQEADSIIVDENYTVDQLMDDYIKDKENRKNRPQYSAREIKKAHIESSPLGALKVGELNHKRIKEWHETLAATPPGNSTREVINPDREYQRKRQATANRILVALLAALNWGFKEGKVESKAAWERIKKFEGVDVARICWFTSDEVTALLNNCPDEDFKRLVQGALFTGARYAELCRLKVADFNIQSRNIFIEFTKSGHSRHVELTPAAFEWFRYWTEGRKQDEYIFLKSNGTPWNRCEQRRPMKRACKAAGIEKQFSFHILRHTNATHARENKMEIGVLAKQLGHVDQRITQKHYGHIGEAYAKQEVALHGPTFGITAPSDTPGRVIPIQRVRKRA